MSSDPQAPVELSFQAAYDRLHEVAEELGADDAMAPERLIALLREGKGLERALREHLERVEQEIRDIDRPDAAATFRIVDAPGEAERGSGLATPPASSRNNEAPAVPPPAARTTEAPVEPPVAAPSIPFADDDIPF